MGAFLATTASYWLTSPSTFGPLATFGALALRASLTGTSAGDCEGARSDEDDDDEEARSTSPTVEERRELEDEELTPTELLEDEEPTPTELLGSAREGACDAGLATPKAACARGPGVCWLIA